MSENNQTHRAFPEQKYDLILADCPWFYRNRQQSGTRYGGGAHRHYPLMPDDELRALPVQWIAADRCMLLMWATAPRLDFAVNLLEEWGFRFVTVAFTWIKYHGPDVFYKPGIQPSFPTKEWRPAFGVGFYAKSNAEFVLMGFRGKPSFKPATDKVSSLLIAPRSRHSEKPAELQLRVEAMYPTQTKIELFARKSRPGWDSWGNEVAP